VSTEPGKRREISVCFWKEGVIGGRNAGGWARGGSMKETGWREDRRWQLEFEGLSITLWHGL
jgi:hypothetical protein